MTKSAKKEHEDEEYYLTEKGRRFIREERFMQQLTDKERKAYEECMALLQSIGENESLENACDWLEQYASEEEPGS